MLYAAQTSMLSKIPRRYWAIAVVAVIIVIYACSNNTQSLRTQQSESRFGVPISRFAGAETFRHVRSPELIEEVKKLVEQNGLPADIFVDNIPQETNIALALDSLFHEYYLREPNDLQKLWEASPIDDWEVDKQALDRIADILVQFDVKRRVIRNMLRQTRTTRFYYIFDYRDSLGTIVLSGTPVNTSASKYLADYALLEEYVVAQSLLEGNIDAAMEALAFIFRIAYLATKLENVGVRGDAALVRLRTFKVMQRVVLDPQFNRNHMAFLRDMLLEQYENWTSEYVTWFGDRASGISLYHRILLDGAENALEEREFNLLNERGVWNTFSRNFRRNHESDAVFYLRSMQKILDVSDRPFVDRQDVLRQIDRDIFLQKDTMGEFFVANILLKDIENLMRIFAKDKSALSRAIVVIQQSLGQGNTDGYRDPFTGEPYEVRRVDGRLSVSAENFPHPFRVPIYASP